MNKPCISRMYKHCPIVAISCFFPVQRNVQSPYCISDFDAFLTNKDLECVEITAVLGLLGRAPPFIVEYGRPPHCFGLHCVDEFGPRSVQRALQVNTAQDTHMRGIRA